MRQWATQPNMKREIMGKSLQNADRGRINEALAKAEENRRKAEATVAELAAVAASLTPAEPHGEGTVVRWSKWEGGYQYASIRGKNDVYGVGVWFTTQDPNRTGGNKILPLSWGELLSKIDERNWNTLEVLS